MITIRPLQQASDEAKAFTLWQEIFVAMRALMEMVFRQVTAVYQGWNLPSAFSRAKKKR